MRDTKKKTILRSIRIDPDLKDEIQRDAEKNERTFSGSMIYLVKKGLEVEGAKND